LLNRKITLLLALAIFFAAFGFLPVSAAENQANLSVSVVERKSTDTINDFDFEEQKNEVIGGEVKGSSIQKTSQSFFSLMRARISSLIKSLRFKLAFK